VDGVVTPNGEFTTSLDTPFQITFETANINCIGEQSIVAKDGQFKATLQIGSLTTGQSPASTQLNLESLLFSWTAKGQDFRTIDFLELDFLNVYLINVNTKQAVDATTSAFVEEFSDPFNVSFDYTTGYLKGSALNDQGQITLVGNGVFPESINGDAILDDTIRGTMLYSSGLPQTEMFVQIEGTLMRASGGTP
jgi:hypothetical protein